jgi:uncharacterized protein (TIGR00156 family)
MWKRRPFIAICACGLLATSALAQFSGPSVAGRSSTAVEARDARVGSYLTLEGNIVNHLRGDYYTFRDASGEIRVEISSSVWNGRQVGPNDKVRLLGEVDSGSSGRYVWVKTLDVLR